MVVDSLVPPVTAAPTAKPDETAARSIAPVSIEGLLNPINTMAETSGAMSEKADFFAARKENKMRLDVQKATQSRPASSVYALCNEEGLSSYKFGPAGEGAANEQITKSVQSAESPIISPLPETSNCGYRFIPEADLPPAVDSASNPCGAADRHSRRTHVGISDIVNSCQQAPETGKRKADNISDTTNEQEVWAAKAKKASVETCMSDLDQESEHAADGPDQEALHRASLPTLSVAAEPQHTGTEPEDMPSVELGGGAASCVAATQIPERPAKRARMMRIAERVGYAAFGGVTAGAMIVGTLIYTAPTFG